MRLNVQYVLQTFKVMGQRYHKLSSSKGSKVKVIALLSVLASKDRYISRMDRLTEFKLCANYPIAEHMKRVKGHKVKYSNCNNSAADCSTSLKFGTVSSSRHRRFKVRDERSRSRRNVKYQLQ